LIYNAQNIFDFLDDNGHLEIEKLDKTLFPTAQDFEKDFYNVDDKTFAIRMRDLLSKIFTPLGKKLSVIHY
jgi:phage antirepressor YoqD-like protein